MWAVLLNGMRLAGWSAMIVGGALLVRGIFCFAYWQCHLMNFQAV